MAADEVGQYKSGSPSTSSSFAPPSPLRQFRVSGHLIRQGDCLCAAPAPLYALLRVSVVNAGGCQGSSLPPSSRECVSIAAKKELL
ncbi:uncharacterized protein LOC117246255 isoform X2 [Epinephelus lanceolatus]